jgi:hypothetical protein
MKTSNDDGSSFIVRDPATRLAAAGLEVFPLCDETLRRPNAAAARHFPATCAAVRAAGGFGARLWVLSPDTKVSRAHREVGFSRGVSDGYWRAHVVLDADEAETETFSFAERTTLGDFAGIRAGDEIRRAEIGDLIVVNDAFEKRWFHDKQKGACRKGFRRERFRRSPRRKARDARETRRQKKRRATESRRGGRVDVRRVAAGTRGVPRVVRAAQGAAGAGGRGEELFGTHVAIARARRAREPLVALRETARRVLASKYRRDVVQQTAGGRLLRI